MNKYRTFLPRNEWAVLLIFFSALILLYLPALFLCDIPERDAAFRYAPAAEAFARGDWLAAFHPRMQMLHPFISGLFVQLFSINGFLAAKCPSLLFCALGIFPFYFLLKEAFSRRVANWGLLFYLFSSKVIYLGYSGLRESHKQLVILLLALSVILIWKNRGGIKGYLCLGFASGLAVCTRNDIILYTVLVFSGSAILDAWKNRIPWRSGVGFCLAFAVSLPEFFINNMISGYFLPGARFFTLFQAVFHQDPTFGNVILSGILPALAGLMIAAPAAAWVLKRKTGRFLVGILFLAGLAACFSCMFTDQFICEEGLVKAFVRGLIKGTVPLLGVMALPGLLHRIAGKKMTGSEYLLLSKKKI